MAIHIILRITAISKTITYLQTNKPRFLEENYNETHATQYGGMGIVKWQKYFYFSSLICIARVNSGHVVLN